MTAMTSASFFLIYDVCGDSAAIDSLSTGTQAMEDRKLPSNSQMPPIIAARHSPSSGLDRTKAKQQPYSPFVRLAIVAGIFLPIATVPYLLSRRRISGLQRTCEELEFKLNVVQRQLNASFSGISNVKSEQAKMRALLHDMVQERDNMRQDAIQRAAEQEQANEVMQSNLRKVLEETELIR